MGLLLVWLLTFPSLQSGLDYPHTDDFVRGVRKALQLDFEIQKDFSYLERRRDVKISRLGKVTIGPLRTFEVYPSEQTGRTYKRLVEVDGKPLTATELAQRDAERQRDLLREAEREGTETPRQRTERLQRGEADHQYRLAMIDDAMAVFEPRFVGREVIDDTRVLVADLKPRQTVTVKTREGGWMKHFEGRIWVDESNHQLVKLDMRAFEDVAIGWGIVGRLRKDSGLLFQRRQFEGVWLPAQMTYRASGRTLLFRPFEFSVTTTYWNYKRR